MCNSAVIHNVASGKFCHIRNANATFVKPLETMNVISCDPESSIRSDDR